MTLGTYASSICNVLIACGVGAQNAQKVGAAFTATGLPHMAISLHLTLIPIL